MPKLLRILNVAYSLTPVSRAACGGTEQILATLLAAFAQPPYSEWLDVATVAAAGSRIPGHLVATNPGYWSHPQRAAHVVYPAAEQALDEAHHAAVAAELARVPYDLVHNQGGAWYGRAAAAPPPVLFTLHLPASHYPREFLAALPANVFLQCVSRTQWQQYAAHPRCLGWIANGVDLDWFSPAGEPGGYFLWLGRICPEKAPHWAIAIAERLRRPLVLAGAVHPFAAHVAYFRREVGPRLGGAVRWLPAPSAAERRALSRQCRAVLLPSQAEETSSLVAMEAAACGRPVVATPRGALPEIVRDGESGWLATSVEELIAAADRVAVIRSDVCRQLAVRDFDARRMAAQYAALYRRLAALAESRSRPPLPRYAGAR